MIYTANDTDGITHTFNTNFLFSIDGSVVSLSDSGITTELVLPDEEIEALTLVWRAEHHGEGETNICKLRAQARGISTMEEPRRTEETVKLLKKFCKALGFDNFVDALEPRDDVC